MPKADIAAQGYDLSLNRDKDVVHEEVNHRSPDDIVGIDRDELLSWDPLTRDGERPKSFLDGIESVRLREDSMIVHDLTRFPGSEEIRSAPRNFPLISVHVVTSPPP